MMKISKARENVLWDYIQKTPGGYKKLAEAAVMVLPYSSLKTLVEALNLEDQVKEMKKSK